MSGLNLVSQLIYWQANVSNESLLNLTAHWITGTFEQKAVMLHAQRIDGSHTGPCIVEKITGMLRSWDISHDQVHFVLRDNGSNMVRAIKMLLFAFLGMFCTHTMYNYLWYMMEFFFRGQLLMYLQFLGR